MKQSFTLCTCGKAPAYRDGLCVGCYSVQTASVIIQQQTPGKCQHCGRPGIKARERCGTCYHYVLKHGIDRPLVKRRTYVCKQCGVSPHHAKGLCMTCYSHRYKYDCDRPQEAIEESGKRKRLKSGVCATCGKEIGIRYECTPCRSYRRRHGVVRPERFFREERATA